MKKDKCSQRGQAVIILLLVMVVALAVGLSVVGRSVTEISTSSKTEDSTRAFSAAEAGLEKAFKTLPLTPVPTLSFSNQSQASVSSFQLPREGIALEYPPFGKESFAQFWLANYAAPVDGAGFPLPSYNQTNFEIYFGKPDSDGSYYNSIPDEKPAVEVHVVRRNGSFYEDKKYFYDSYSGSGSSARNNTWGGCAELNPAPIETNDSGQSSFYCRVSVPPVSDGFVYDATHYLVLVRVRVLYSNLAHPVALKPGTITSVLPAQVNIYTSTGTAGKSQRKLQVFQQNSVLPHYFDYVLFSAGSLSKAIR